VLKTTFFITAPIAIPESTINLATEFQANFKASIVYSVTSTTKLLIA